MSTSWENGQARAQELKWWWGNISILCVHPEWNLGCLAREENWQPASCQHFVLDWKPASETSSWLKEKSHMWWGCSMIVTFWKSKRAHQQDEFSLTSLVAISSTMQAQKHTSLHWTKPTDESQGSHICNTSNANLNLSLFQPPLNPCAVSEHQKTQFFEEQQAITSQHAQAVFLCTHVRLMWAEQHTWNVGKQNIDSDSVNKEQWIKSFLSHQREPNFDSGCCIVLQAQWSGKKVGCRCCVHVGWLFGGFRIRGGTSSCQWAEKFWLHILSFFKTCIVDLGVGKWFPFSWWALFHQWTSTCFGMLCSYPLMNCQTATAVLATLFLRSFSSWKLNNHSSQ